MKQRHQCPKCGSRDVGYFESVMDHQKGVKPEKRALAQTIDGESWQGFMHNSADVEAYVCTHCGYFEEYVKAPQAVKWDSFDAFRWLNRPNS